MITRKELDIHKFQWKGLGFVEVKGRKKLDRLKKNTEVWIHFVSGICQKYCPNPPHGKQWSALGLYMNKKNIEYLRGLMNEWIWSDIAPMVAEVLEDDEYGVKVDELLVDCR